MFCARQTGWKDAASVGALGILTTDVPICRWPENFCANLGDGDRGGVFHSLRNTTHRNLIQNGNCIRYADAVYCLMSGKMLCDDVNHFSHKEMFILCFLWIVHTGCALAFKTQGSWGIFFQVKLLLTWCCFKNTELMLQDAEQNCHKMVFMKRSYVFVLWEVVKGLVNQKMKILSSFTHPQVVPNLYVFILLWVTCKC